MEGTVDRPGGMCVVLAADDSYAQPLAVAGRSLIEHVEAARSMTVYVIACGMTPASKSRVLSSWDSAVRARFLDVAPVRLDSLPFAAEAKTAHLNRSIYLRLLVAELLPAHCDRVLYLDADTLARADVTELWDADLRGQPLAAVQDRYIPFVSSPSSGLAGIGSDFPPGAKYFNSGVLLIDLEAWRSENLAGRALEYIARNRARLKMPDQDALNAVFYGRWTEVDRSWNVMIGQSMQLDEPGARPAPAPGGGRGRERILHFVGARKPWMRAFRQPSYQRIYLHYRRKTAWAEAPLD